MGSSRASAAGSRWTSEARPARRRIAAPVRPACLAAALLAPLWCVGCASIPAPPESPGMQRTLDQERSDLEKELSLYSD
ncbi:hypothetical protein OJF2_69810 [Aquisphaera giovannonii]|uniref:Uncharacterized protein n=1 Tax=Aquisphaera giovannonii TaxID=406548 RepID=A0A5B9WES1_9BACT|nr:hypothetical protein [Aquisphaera giovannonii]QEH38380.1 hypothetical protein OJF2_69810 [Aquisphaera giovannonii]